MDGGKNRKIQDFGQFWQFLVIWGARRVPLGAPTPHFGSLTYSSVKYLQNETSPRLLAQSVQGLFRIQGELSKNEGFFWTPFTII